MIPTRGNLVGPPHTYLVSVETALGTPLLTALEGEYLKSLLDHLREPFGVRIFAYAITPTQFTLIVRHAAVNNDTDDGLRRRWQAIGGSPLTPLSRLKQRFTTLSGFMQTLLQRFSREWNRRHKRRGHVWAGRYRACLLADDLSLLATVAWLEQRDLQAHSSAHTRQSPGLDPMLAALPLRVGPDGGWYTADESPPGLSPLREAEIDAAFLAFVAEIPHSDLACYGSALERSWAFGRPESLSQTLARLARPSGRGRSRQLHDLDDQLGLCGVWG